MNEEQEIIEETKKVMLNMYRMGMKDILVNIGTGCYVTAFILKFLIYQNQKH